MSNYVRRFLCYGHVYCGKNIKLLFRKYVKGVIGSLWLFWLNIIHYFFRIFAKYGQQKTSLMWSIQECLLNYNEFKVTRMLKTWRGLKFQTDMKWTKYYRCIFLFFIEIIKNQCFLTTNEFVYIYECNHGVFNNLCDKSKKDAA